MLGALRHRDFLVAAWHFRDRGIHVGVSRSRDGDRVDGVLERLGYGASARGSSSRGGVSAQLALSALIENGRSVAIVVDGPRGPAGVPKPGVAQLASRSQRPIVPVQYAASWAWRFGSWDRALLPLPFARVECRFGEPIAADPNADSPDASQTAMLTALAEQLAARPRSAS